ncbi:MAG: type IV pilus assembly protein PilM [Bacillota bacterium]
MDLGVTKKTVGLEIDTGTARVVEAAGSAKKPKLLSIAEINLPEGAVEEGMIVQSDQVGHALRELWAKEAIKHRKVLLGVSNQGVLVRYATIPKVAPGKLENVIRFYSQDHLPIPLESVVLDYTIIGEEVEEERPVYEVLLVAARRDMLDGFLHALEVAKLEPDDIDVSTLALMQILPAVALDRTVVMVNVANGLSNILIADKNQPRLARLVAAKLKDLTSGLGKNLDYLFEGNRAEDENARKIFSTWANHLISEVRSSLNYYQNQDNSQELEAIIFNGRGARLKGFSDKMEADLGLPVRIVNPFADFSNADKLFKDTGIKAVDYAISAGLARRGLEG